jgi:hypothetical protein
MSDTKNIELSQIAAHLFSRLFVGLDTNVYSEAAACFSADGVWHRQGKILQGKTQILAALEQRPAGRKTLHVVTNMIAKSSGINTADVSYYLLAYRYDLKSREEGPAPIVAPIVMGICQARIGFISKDWRVVELRTGPDYMFKATISS